MSKKLSTYIELLKNNESALLNFLKAKFPVFHNSNFFFRDLQYGIRSFFEKKDITVSYQDAEKLAANMAKYFEEKGVFVKVNYQAWKVNHRDFVTAAPGDPF